MGADQAAGGTADILSGLGDQQATDSSALSEEDLATLVDGNPADTGAEQALALLEDPNTPPEVRQMIEMQLATAARRRMAGIVGGAA